MKILIPLKLSQAVRWQEEKEIVVAGRASGGDSVLMATIEADPQLEMVGISEAERCSGGERSLLDLDPGN